MKVSCVIHLRVIFSVQVEQLEQEVAMLQQALADKQEQEKAMLQVAFHLSIFLIL